MQIKRGFREAETCENGVQEEELVLKWLKKKMRDERQEEPERIKGKRKKRVKERKQF